MYLRMLTASAVALGSAIAALAGPSEDVGWSLSLDPRHRAFLSWRSQPGQARDLLLGCLRDVDAFTVRSETLGSLEESSNARLALASRFGHFEAAGTVSRDQDSGQSVFDSDLDIDGGKRKALASQLLPVLGGRDDITLTISLGLHSPAATFPKIPIAGLAPLLDRFRSVCFK